MQLSKSLLYLVLLSVSPLCRAYSDEDLEADKLRVRELIRTSQTKDAKISNTQELLDIYRRVSPHYTPEDRVQLDRLIRDHNEQLFFEGVHRMVSLREALSSAVKEMAVFFFNEIGASLSRLIAGKAKIEETEEYL